jgi:hypothetical protein
MNEKVFYYYAKIIKVLKEVLDSNELTPEEKIKVLATIL